MQVEIDIQELMKAITIYMAFKGYIAGDNFSFRFNEATMSINAKFSVTETDIGFDDIMKLLKYQ